jgi:hypothetical protein
VEASTSFMALTLRPTGLQCPPAFQHLKDYSVYEDGTEIGRMYEAHAPARPDLAWYWSITVLGPGRGRVRTEGNAATLEEAKVQFAAAWTAFKVVQQDSDSRER